MNHTHHPEGNHEENAKCWINYFSKELQPLDHQFLVLIHPLAIQFLHGCLLYFLIYADQAKTEMND